MLLKLLAKKPLEALRIMPYTKEKAHHIELQVSPQGNDYADFLIPLPIETHSQHLGADIRIMPAPSTRISTDTHDVAVFNKGELQKHKQVALTFPVTVRPIIAKTADNFTLADYADHFSFSTEHANSDDLEIRETASSLVSREQNIVRIVKKLYEYTLSSLTYGDPIEGLYSYKDALTKEKVDCGGFCMLLSSLLGVFNISHRLAVGFLTTSKKEKPLSMHVWLEVLLPDGSVFPLDPSVDWRRRHGQSTRWGGFGFVGSDRIIVSYGHDVEVKIGNKKRIFELLQNPIAV